MTDLVVASLERWDALWRRNQYLVDGLLKADPRLRVLFVEPAADPLHDLTARRRPQFGQRARRSDGTDRLWTMRPVKLVPRRLDPRADDRLARGILATARRCGFADPVMWINDPGLAPLAEITGWPTIYDITDDWLAAHRSTAELARLARGEASLLERAAEVVVCSRELERRKSPQRSLERHPIVLIPNAVDVEAYRRPRPRPDDLPSSRTAVYAGTLHGDRFDVALATDTARVLGRDANLVLVGPNLLRDDASKALRGAGVLILGPRTPDELVAYLQHADVLIVPHLVDAFTDSLDPIKLYEYQAVGRPVVSTPVAGFRDVQDDHVLIADAELFPQQVLRSMAGAEPFPAGADRAVPDWADRISAMGTVLSRVRGN